MSWERDPLWAKSRLFLERALEYPRDDAQFGLWCTLALELLARAAVASVSPALLAEPDQSQKNLLHALGKGDPRSGVRSISVTQTVKLCQHLFEGFAADHTTTTLALINRRNEELHTGAAGFEGYPTQHWIAGFYRCCFQLTSVLGESMDALFGAEEAAVADDVLKEVEQEIATKVREAIKSHRGVFERRTETERTELSAKAKTGATRLSHARHHAVTCPACGSPATVQGETFGPARVTHDDDDREVVVKQAAVPRTFACVACDLKLASYPELSAAGVGGQYTRTSTYSPEEYFELINPEDHETIRDLVERHLEMYGEGEEYDNE